LPEVCLATLRQHRAQQAEEKLRLGLSYTDHGLVFCRADGNPLDLSILGRAFSQALQRACLAAIRLHDTRHTYATWLLAHGVSHKVAQPLLGHSSISMTLGLYSHMTLDLEKQASATLNAVLTRGLQ
jgi:integrase